MGSKEVGEVEERLEAGEIVEAGEVGECESAGLRDGRRSRVRESSTWGHVDHEDVQWAPVRPERHAVKSGVDHEAAHGHRVPVLHGSKREQERGVRMACEAATWSPPAHISPHGFVLLVAD